METNLIKDAVLIKMESAAWLNSQLMNLGVVNIINNVEDNLMNASSHRVSIKSKEFS